MKKFLCVLFIGFVFIITYSYALPVSYSDREVQKIAKPIIKNVIEAYNKTNYSKIAVYFDELMFSDFSQDKFEETRREIFPLYGSLKSVKYLGYVTQLDATIVLYKGEFEKSEGLIRVVLSDDEDKINIVGLWFE